MQFIWPSYDLLICMARVVFDEISTNPGAKAAAAEAFAPATGETFVPADQSTVVVSITQTMEPVAL